MDADGYVKITGRIKDLIIRGGENIHPLEIENALFKHPAISEASLVGIPDEKYGEVVAAFIIVHKGVDVRVDDKGEGLRIDEKHYPQEKHLGEGVKAWAKDRREAGQDGCLSKGEIRTWVRDHLSGHLVPSYVFWVADFPKTASGKIQKFKLREMGVRWLKEGLDEF
jgi:acyl-CoA synthetase (AMP-forming)/AMP-acid ligase II